MYKILRLPPLLFTLCKVVSFWFFPDPSKVVPWPYLFSYLHKPILWRSKIKQLFSFYMHTVLHSRERDEWNRTQLSSEVFKCRGCPCRQYCSWPPGSKYECPYCPLPLLLPQFLRLLCPSCGCSTSVPLYLSSSVPNCTSLSATFLSQAGSCIMRRLGKTWTWAQLERCPAETSIYPAPRRTKEQEGNPKIYGYSSGLQWAIYKGS